MTGLAVGRYGEFSKSLADLLGYFARRKAAIHEDLAGVAASQSLGSFKWDLRRRFVLFAARGWARLRLDRAKRLRLRGRLLCPAVGEGVIWRLPADLLGV